MNKGIELLLRASLSLADAYMELSKGVSDDDILDVVDGMVYALCKAVYEDRHIFLNYEIWAEKSHKGGV